LDALTGLRFRAWIRESTKGQYDRHGPESQRENIARFAERYGLIEAAPEIVVAHRGKTVWKSSKMRELIASVRLEEFDVLLVGYADRWQRNLRRTLELVEDELHPHGVAWVIADRRLVSGDPRDWDQMVDEAHDAEQYSTRLSGKVRDGYAAKSRVFVDQGGGLTPLGFRRTPKEEHKLLVPDPETMATAVRVWELAAQGRSDAAIAAELSLTLWTVRGTLRSSLYLGRLRDGRETRFAAPIDGPIAEQALAFRRSRTRAGNREKARTYPLTGGGPLMCDVCHKPIKGAAKRRRDGSWGLVYRHNPDSGGCSGWPVKEVATSVLESQVEAMLVGCTPNQESAARIRAALATPKVAPDRLAIARADASLRTLGLELVAAEQRRPTQEILEEILVLRAERARLASTTIESDAVDAEQALDWLSGLASLWRQTTEEGRRALAVAVFAQLGSISEDDRGSHRIVTVVPTEDAESKGLSLALPARIEVTLVGDTGFEPVTSRM
jgi:DNA invertase Pin-like site-specific DNA recombinase